MKQFNQESSHQKKVPPPSDVAVDMKKKNVAYSAIHLNDENTREEPPYASTNYKLFLDDEILKSEASHSERNLSDNDDDCFSISSEQCDIILDGRSLNTEASVAEDKHRRTYEELKKQIDSSINSVYLEECERDKQLDLKTRNLQLNFIRTLLLIYQGQPHIAQEKDGMSLRDKMDLRLQNISKILDLLNRSVKSQLETKEANAAQIKELKDAHYQLSSILTDKENTINFLNAAKISLEMEESRLLELIKSMEKEYDKRKKQFESNLEEVKRKLSENVTLCLLQNKSVYDKELRNKQIEIESLKTDVKVQAKKLIDLSQQLASTQAKLNFTQVQLLTSKQKQQKLQIVCKAGEARMQKQLAYLSELDSTIYQKHKESFEIELKGWHQEFAKSRLQQQKRHFTNEQKVKAEHRQQIQINRQFHRKQIDELKRVEICRQDEFKSKMGKCEEERATLMTRIEQLEKEGRQNHIVFVRKDQEYRCAKKKKAQDYEEKWMQTMKQLEREKISNIQIEKLMKCQEEKARELKISLERRNLDLAGKQNELYFIRLNLSAKDEACRHQLQKQKVVSQQNLKVKISDIVALNEQKLKQITDINLKNITELRQHYESMIAQHRQIQSSLSRHYSEQVNKLKSRAETMSQLNEANILCLQRQLKSKQRIILDLQEDIQSENEKSMMRIFSLQVKIDDQLLQMQKKELLVQRYQHKIAELENTIMRIKSTIKQISSSFDTKQNNFFEKLLNGIEDSELAACIWVMIDCYSTKRIEAKLAQIQACSLLAKCTRQEQINISLLTENQILQGSLRLEQQTKASLASQQQSSSAALSKLSEVHEGEIKKCKIQLRQLNARNEAETQRLKVELKTAKSQIQQMKQASSKHDQQYAEVKTQLSATKESLKRVEVQRKELQINANDIELKFKAQSQELQKQKKKRVNLNKKFIALSVSFHQIKAEIEQINGENLMENLEGSADMDITANLGQEQLNQSLNTSATTNSTET